jgi:hypothetical protein
METQLTEMKREIAYLKASVASFARQHPEGTVQASGSGCLPDGPGSPSLAVSPAGSSTEKPPPVPHGKEVCGKLQKHGILLDSPSLSASSGLSNRKRPTSPLHHGESDSGDSGSEASQLSIGKRPQKRINNHDKTCYTIQVFSFTQLAMVPEMPHRLQCGDIFIVPWGLAQKMSYLPVTAKGCR